MFSAVDSSQPSKPTPTGKDRVMYGALATIATLDADVVLVASDAVPIKRKAHVVRLRSQTKYLSKMQPVPVSSAAHAMRKVMDQLFAY